MADDSDQARTNLEAQGRMGEIVGSGDYDRLTEVLADGLVDHDPAPGQSVGPKGIGEFWAGFKQAFPDVALEPVQVSAWSQRPAAPRHTVIAFANWHPAVQHAPPSQASPASR